MSRWIVKKYPSTMAFLLTCSLEHGAGYGLDTIADRTHGYGVVPPWLEVVHRELWLLHRDTGAVSIECLQLMVLDLKKTIKLLRWKIYEYMFYIFVPYEPLMVVFTSM